MKEFLYRLSIQVASTCITVVLLWILERQFGFVTHIIRAIQEIVA